VVEGVVGSTFEGDIAVDDLRTTVGDCPPNGFCDFENIFCSWNNIRSKGIQIFSDKICSVKYDL